MPAQQNIFEIQPQRIGNLLVDDVPEPSEAEERVSINLTEQSAVREDE